MAYKFVFKKFKENVSDLSTVMLYRGSYSQAYFANLMPDQFLPTSICVIDSDIYESCVDVLEFIKDHILSRSILLFDDYNSFDKNDRQG